MLLSRARGAGRATRSSSATAARRGIASPADPPTRSTTPPGPTTCSCATTRRARSPSAGATRPGCRRWFNAVRDTLTNEVSAVYPPGAPRPDMTRSRERRAPPSERRPHRPLEAAALRVRRRGVPGVRGRHAGVRAAGQRCRRRRRVALPRSAARRLRGGRRRPEHARPGGAPGRRLRADAPGDQVELVDGLVARPCAGRGRLERRADTSRFDHRYTHVDVLVVGGGPAGIAAAVAAGRTGARVSWSTTVASWADRSGRCPRCGSTGGRAGRGSRRSRGDDTPPGDADPDPRDGARAV